MGNGPNTHSEETKAKIAAAIKGRVPWNKGKSLPQETKDKISEKNRGKSPWNYDHDRAIAKAEKKKQRLLKRIHNDYLQARSLEIARDDLYEQLAKGQEGWLPIAQDLGLVAEGETVYSGDARMVSDGQ